MFIFTLITYISLHISLSFIWKSYMLSAHFEEYYDDVHLNARNGRGFYYVMYDLLCIKEIFCRLWLFGIYQDNISFCHFHWEFLAIACPAFKLLTAKRIEPSLSNHRRYMFFRDDRWSTSIDHNSNIALESYITVLKET